MFTTLVILASLAIVFYKYVTYRQSYWQRKGVKGPKPMFFLGHFVAGLFQKEAFAYDIDRVYKYVSMIKFSIIKSDK